MGNPMPKLPSRSKLTGNPEDYSIFLSNADSTVWQLITSHNCLNCHQINSKLVGPSFEDIARRYGGEDSVMTYLPKRIIGGGIGNWPGNIAMPANLSLKETEAEEITQFILGLNEFVDMPQ